MNQNQQQGVQAAPRKENIIRSFNAYKSFLANNGITHKTLQDERNAEIENSNISAEDKIRGLKQIEGLYLKTESNLLRGYILQFLAFEFDRGEILVGHLLDAAQETLNDVSKATGVKFTTQDKMEIYFQILDKILFKLNVADQEDFNEKEMVLIGKRMKKSLKDARAFGRPTPITDTIEEV